MNIEDLTIGQAKELAAMFGATTEKAAAADTQTAVIVCTDKRGVFFGYTTNTNGRPITLTGARMALYWSADVGGVLGLAEIGPTSGCKISAPAPTITLEGVTCVITVDAKAEKAWINAPVQGR